MLASAVAEKETDFGETSPYGSPTPPAVDDIAGIWVGDVRQTVHGPMTFVFMIGANGSLDITGTPADSAAGDEYHRRGSSRLEGELLVSPVLNEGQPIHVALHDGRLTLTFDESLAFHLRRE